MNVGQELALGAHLGVLPEPKCCEAVVSVGAVSAAEGQLPQLSTQGNFPSRIQ